MSTLKLKNVQVGSDATATNNFTIYQPATPDGTLRIGVGNSGATTKDVLSLDSNGGAKIKAVQIGTDANATNNFTIYQPATPDGTLRIGVGNSGATTKDVIKVNADGGVNTMGPAFSAYMNATQSVGSGAYTKLQVGTKDFDVDNSYDTTLFRFTAKIAGYYHFDLSVSSAQQASLNTNTLSAIYKNGSLFRYGGYSVSTGQESNQSWSGIIYLVVGDYIEPYVYTSGAAITVTQYSSFSAFLARAA